MENSATDFSSFLFFPTPFFFSIDPSKREKNLKYHRVSGQSFPVPDFPNWKEKWWRKGERERDRESFHSGTSIHRAKGKGGPLKGPPISLN